MMKHTQGPWSTRLVRNVGLKAGSHVHVLTDREGFNIALISSWIDNTDTAEEAIANSRLIEAAPELLEALVALVECEQTTPELWEAARAAIAKATA
ncbi:hypothetical protein [Pseudomonas aeruginosa]|uniref:hypothetical protein n=1 Tax=Pseudomonas aeruginosa TaxID=287 RepID=UPI000B49635F|nr:hypothetical protein [Pseudomonas aeruginosa]EKM6335129.1 hypothetical protein [Pseudomonas aeruginosa]EKX0314450.1 hypothetical protein [Pseudomonas aeruginosa]ELF5759309.1 hypothetical protein [Pseudomonas aeruginosa]MBF3231432.1 hypothetical protein [Pseudomonas aeruginosa]MBF3253045.1 hypothetical protein [Pseudomonas aeruginosa]